VYYDALVNNTASQQVSQDLVQMPSVNSPANPLLPQNFVKTNAEQLPIPINQKSLDFKLDSNFSDLQKNITNDVGGKFSQLAGTSLPSLPDSSISMSVLEKSIQKAQDQFSINSNNQMLSILNSNKQVESLGAINQSFTSSINNSTNLSPRGIRDLKSPDILNQQITNTTNSAVSKAKEGVKEQVTALTQNQTFNQSGQTNLQQLSVPAFSGDNKNGFDLFARLTVYWANGSGTDKDSAAKQSSTGRQLAQGVSAAVDPSVIPYLSRIEIPGLGTRFATDTGGAVKARTASAGRLPIIDIFFDNKEEALAMANKMKNEVTVKVFPPSSKYTYVKNASPTYGVA
jgi:3D (Asp-Asp-Asp) domain-containing protein